jgi:hypothetical protein
MLVVPEAELNQAANESYPQILMQFDNTTIRSWWMVSYLT